ncbi:MAG TPA: hypothetical protein DCG49_02115 [Ruminococcus sp.]|nr:hypothetical protein [Ruminococcus sp.]
MKPFSWARNVLFFCAPACFFCTACTSAAISSDFSPQIDESYSANAELSYGDGQSAQLLLTRYADGLWESAFSEPPSLAGVVLTFDGNAVSASYKGLAFTIPKAALPARNMLALVIDSLDQAAADDNASYLQLDDGSWALNGQCDGGSYTLTFAADGSPASFEVPSQPLLVTFTDYAACAPISTDSTTASTSDSSVPSTSDTTTITQNEGTS